MLAKVLLPDNIVRADGIGPDVDLGADRGKLTVITLGIERVLEQQALTVSVWGSDDKKDWGAKPLVAFPPKYYCGMYSQLLNLAKNPEVRFLRVQWKVSRWAKGGVAPLFGFHMVVEESGTRVRSATAVAVA